MYSLAWPNDINLNHMNVAAAPYGGPIATVRNARKITEVGGASSKPMIRIFTASGKILSSIEVKQYRPLRIIFVTIINNQSRNSFYYSSGIAELY